MSLLTALQSQITYYYENRPEKVPLTLLKSFACGFAITSVFRNDMKLGLIGGAVAMSATLVHALTAPLFKSVYGFDELKMSQEMGRGCLSIFAACCVSRALGTAHPFQFLYADSAIYFTRISLGLASTDLSVTNWFALYPISAR